MTMLLSFPQIVEDYPKVSLIILGIILTVIIAFIADRHSYIDCKVIITKEDGTEAIFYHCVKWNENKKDGLVHNKIKHKWVHLTKRDRTIIREARAKNETPVIRL